MDIFQGPDDTTSAPGGTSFHSIPNNDDHPWVYFSKSNLAQPANNCFEPGPTTNGCACSGPCPLGTALTLNADTTRKLVFTFDNRLNGSGAACTPVLPPNVPLTGPVQPLMSIQQ